MFKPDLTPDTLRRLATPGLDDLPALESAETAWSCHVPFAFWLVAALRPATLVELGVHAGVSYCAFCEAVVREGLSTSAYGVDTWEGDVHAGHYEPAILEQLRRHHDPRFGSFSHLVRARFDEARSHFTPGSIDLLHIDGLHTYEAVKHDFDSWRPLLSSRAVVLFHDTQVRERDFGVWRLWEELRQTCPAFEFPFGHGLGVLGVGQELPEPVAWLLTPAKRPETTDESIIGVFHFLGQRLEARAGMARALKALDATETRMEARMEAQAQCAATLTAQMEAQAEARMAAQAQWVATLTAQAEARQALVALLYRDIEALKSALAATQVQLEARATHVAHLMSSTSWRITAPLRGTVEMLRQGVRRLRSWRRADWRTTLSGFADAPSASAPAMPTLKPAYPLRDAWYDKAKPEVSLIVLNFNKPELTLACIDSLFEHTAGYRYEVVLVDNGSDAAAFMQLAPLEAQVRLLRLGVNRFFGEGNNLGFEAARGHYVVFLNNDVTVTADWLAPLIDRLAKDASIGGVGPKMVYPDGRLQEAGARILADGSSEQFGKGGDPADPEFNQERDVGYVSAAAFALRREDFASVLGFDLLFEPAYYEDSDLCMRLHQRGLRIVYCPASTVFHHENATSRDYARELRIHETIALNRERFVERWGPVLRNEATAIPGLLPAPESRSFPTTGPTLLLYTPYNLIPGGGERYLLTIAAGMSARMRVTLATAQPYSRLRLRTLGRELGLDLDAVRITTLDAVAGETFDRSVVMGNELLPSLAGRARRNVYICQFPFPIDAAWLAAHWDTLAGYERVVVYCAFVERHYRRILGAHGKQPPMVTVVTPPAVLAPPAASGAPITPKRRAIISVGRFFVGGHSKRHDLMIDAFRMLHARLPDAELHLVGSLAAEPAHMAHYQSLRKMAEGLPVHFHVNAAPAQIDRLYAEASLYWHLAGFGVDEQVEPHRCEHFGITVVEAMSAGCIPLVYCLGGPATTVNNGVSGHVFGSLEELVSLSAGLLAAPPDDVASAAMRAAAVAASRNYSAEAFVANMTTLLAEDA